MRPCSRVGSSRRRRRRPMAKARAMRTRTVRRRAAKSVLKAAERPVMKIVNTRTAVRRTTSLSLRQYPRSKTRRRRPTVTQRLRQRLRKMKMERAVALKKQKEKRARMMAARRCGCRRPVLCGSLAR